MNPPEKIPLLLLLAAVTAAQLSSIRPAAVNLIGYGGTP